MSDTHLADCRLYLLTPPEINDLDQFAETLSCALKAGLNTAAEVACVQLRLKGCTDDHLQKVARRLMPICHQYRSILLLNDRVDIALTVGADGVHLGQDDMSYQDARSLLGDDVTIGITCHDSKHLALEAGEAGADYVAFGAFFPTETKAVSHHATPDLLAWWSYATTLPSVAIGGITPQNAEILVKSGADFLAVSNGVWGYSEGPEEAIRHFAAILEA